MLPSVPLDHVTYDLQRLKLLRPTVEEGMHLQEEKQHYLIFELDIGFQATVIWDVAQYPLYHVWPTHMQSLNLFYVKWLGSRCIYKDRDERPNIYTLHIPYDLWPAKFEFATSNCLGGDAFARKNIIWPLTLGFVPMAYALLPNIPHNVWHMHLNRKFT